MIAAKKEFINFMLDAGVLRFGSFTTKSGRQSPYFVNTGGYVMGSQLAALGEYYAARILEENIPFDAIFGPAYKGIPLAAVVAATLASRHGRDIPCFFNRKEIKDHGEGGTLIGYQPKDGDRIIVVEDVITAGTTVREFLPDLKSRADLTVSEMFISVDRSEIGQNSDKTAAREVRDSYGLTVHSIVSVADIRDYLDETGDSEHLEALRSYMEQYCIVD